MRRNQETFSFLVFAIFIGGFLRLYPALQVNFPLNDGGLFYQMIIDLQKAHYQLPMLVSYNAANIPFAYPPLAFYLTGLLADLLHVPVLDLVRLLPGVVTTLSLPIFYFLASELTNSKPQIILGSFAYAFLPRAFAWQVMGGGVTRSFGLLFGMLTLLFVLRFYRRRQVLGFLMCTLFGALLVLTHPEITTITAISVLFFYLRKDRSLRGLLASLGIAAGILVLTSPWWGLVVARYGIDPFLAAINAVRQNNLNPLLVLYAFFQFIFSDEPLLSIFSVIGIIGLFASLSRKQFSLPLWLFVIQLFQPRGGPLIMMIPLSLLVGYGLETVILPTLQPQIPPQSTGGSESQSMTQILKVRMAGYFLLFLFAYGTMEAFQTGLRISQELTLRPSDLAAFQWVQDHTPPDSQFLLVTQQQPLLDAWSEWFPALTGRVSQGTAFGYEWVNDGKFGARLDAYRDLQACARQDAACLEGWSAQNSQPFDYILIKEPAGEALIARLTSTHGYHLVYHQDRLCIFQKQ